VPALAPEERRAALIAATIPLLHEHGLEVSTKQIAAAAGVAEGTIFGVFESKNSLVVCSLVKALDAHPTVEAIAAIDPALPLRERLIRAADLVLARFTESAHLLHGLRQMILHGGLRDMPPEAASGRKQMHAAVAALIEPDAALLRRSPGAVAGTLLLFCGANTFGPYADPDELTGAGLVSLLLDGLLIRDEHTRGAQ
jgi:AcrR family transcriptional regulator